MMYMYVSFLYISYILLLIHIKLTILQIYIYMFPTNHFGFRKPQVSQAQVTPFRVSGELGDLSGGGGYGGNKSKWGHIPLKILNNARELNGQVYEGSREAGQGKQLTGASWGFS